MKITHVWNNQDLGLDNIPSYLNKIRKQIEGKYPFEAYRLTANTLWFKLKGPGLQFIESVPRDLSSLLAGNNFTDNASLACNAVSLSIVLYCREVE